MPINKIQFQPGFDKQNDKELDEVIRNKSETAYHPSCTLKMGIDDMAVVDENLKVIDLFSGAGGLSQGFRDAGYKIVSAVEIDKNLSQTYKKNFPKTKLFESDITKIKSTKLLANNSKIDVIIGTHALFSNKIHFKKLLTES